MTAALPDVSLSDLSADPAALDWVGMQGIDLPITLNETGQRQTVHARADLQVDLPRPEVKGIHMSRLYTLLDRLGQDRRWRRPCCRRCCRQWSRAMPIAAVAMHGWYCSSVCCVGDRRWLRRSCRAGKPTR